jgi:phage N-6-adenine-methyltransferase
VTGELVGRVAEGELVDSDATEIGALYQKAKGSLVDSVKYQIECGHKLAEKKAELPHGKWLPWLAENAGVLGFESRVTAHRLLKIANVSSTQHLDESTAAQISRQTWGNVASENHRAAGTGVNEWYTPIEYIEIARDVMGGIDLDPASSAIAQERIQAGHYFTIDDDGLGLHWFGRVWLNPPYSQPEIRLFVEKAVSEYVSGRISQCIVLTHNYTDTAWFHVGAEHSDAICFTRGRIAFLDPDGNKAAPTQGQAFFYFGPEPERFAEAFSSVGFVMVRP